MCFNSSDFLQLSGLLKSSQALHGFMEPMGKESEPSADAQLAVSLLRRGSHFVFKSHTLYTLLELLEDLLGFLGTRKVSHPMMAVWQFFN